MLQLTSSSAALMTRLASLANDFNSVAVQIAMLLNNTNFQ